MRPNRQVRRNDVRPTYARRSARRAPILRLPTIKVGWVRAAAYTTVALFALTVVSRLTTIEHIKVEGAHTIDTGHLTRVTQDGLDHQWFGRNLLLMNSLGLASYVQQAEPGIKQAEVHRQFLHTVSVQITERQPSLNWKSGGVSYLLDADSTVIGPSKGPYTKLPSVTDSSNLPVKAGDRVAPTSFITFCVELAKDLPAAGYPIQEMTVPATTSEVYVKTDKNLLLKFDTTRPAGEEVSDLKAVQAELTKAHKNPQEYIDLRIQHKAYYK